MDILDYKGYFYNYNNIKLVLLMLFKFQGEDLTRKKKTMYAVIGDIRKMFMVMGFLWD